MKFTFHQRKTLQIASQSTGDRERRTRSDYLEMNTVTKRKSIRCKGSCLVAITMGMALLPTGFAWADDWGCQVLLCLADPRGSEAESACVPPIERLWTALRDGDPFPSCDFSSSLSDLPAQVVNEIPRNVLANVGAGSGASNRWANGSYCAPGMLYWGGPEKSELMCAATGVINVTVDGSLFTRVWWGIGGVGSGSSITEYYGSESTAVPYDPSATQQQFLNQQNIQLSGSAGNGGGH